MRIPEADTSRCLRLRCRTFECARCAEACPRAALGFDGRGPTVDPQACTGCGLCVSACPVDGISGAVVDVEELAARLSPLPQPVLGCTGAQGVDAHARVPCLGYLTEEDLAALSALLPQGLQLNGVRCSGCPRGETSESVAGRVARVSVLGPRGELQLVQEVRALSFRERSLDRRSFFRSLGRSSAVKASALLQSAAPGEPPGRSAKHLPRRRTALRLAVHHAEPLAAARLAAAFSFTVTVDADCTACPRCAAMCPTGALTREGEGADRRLEIDPERCTGCGVCEAFCPSGSLRLHNAATVREGDSDAPDQDRDELRVRQVRSLASPAPCPSW